MSSTAGGGLDVVILCANWVQETLAGESVRVGFTGVKVYVL
jgi:hypothetical protein